MTENHPVYDPAALDRVLRSETGPGARERAEHDYLPTLLEGCERFIDVGANVGQYMYSANRHLRGAEILGIEANPHLFDAVKATCAKAAAETPRENRFEVVGCAISDSEAPIEFFVDRDATVGSIFGGGAGQVATVRVASRPLDAFYVPGKKTVVKMDIEGAEFRAMRSAARFLASDHTTFFLELHGWGDVTIRKYPLHVLNLFFESGYACRRVGTHYVFHRAPLDQRIRGWVAAFPELFAKYAAYRWAKGTVPLLRRIRGLRP